MFHEIPISFINFINYEKEIATLQIQVDSSLINQIKPIMDYVISRENLVGIQKHVKIFHLFNQAN